MPFLAAIPAAIGGIAAAAAPAAVGGAATALGSSLAGSLMGGGPGKGVGFQAAPGVSAADVQHANLGTNEALRQQQEFLNALQAQGGIQNQSDVYSQYKDIAAGRGPNPAQQMLANQTGANIASQAALMAGQRGASSNAGLIARQAAQQGAGVQQQAVGQGALMQAQQSLGALGQMGGLASQQVAQQQAAQDMLTRANLQRQAQFQQGLNQQSSINAGIQGQIAEGQIAGAEGVMGGVGTALGALGSSAVESLGKKKKEPQGVGPVASGTQYASMLGKAQGGLIEKSYAQGGPVSNVVKHLKGMPALAKGGKVPAMVSPGEIYLSPSKVKEVVKSNKNPLSEGERIPGKAKVSGDSEANDTVKKTLKEGGIVIPRTKADDSDKAAKFVSAIVAKKGLK